MPIIKTPLAPGGALVEVVLSWSITGARRLRAALRPVPPAVDARAILDTGAEVTCVDSSLIQSLGIPAAGWALGNLPAHGGVNLHPLYDVGLVIVHPSGNSRDNLVVRDLSVMELSLASIGYQMLIGRDVLAKCKFFYDGPGSKFVLAY